MKAFDWIEWAYQVDPNEEWLLVTRETGLMGEVVKFKHLNVWRNIGDGIQLGSLEYAIREQIENSPDWSYTLDYELSTALPAYKVKIHSYIPKGGIAYLGIGESMHPAEAFALAYLQAVEESND